MDQRHHARQVEAPFCQRDIGVLASLGFDVLDRQALPLGAAHGALDVGHAHVVCHSVDPGAQRALRLVARKALPQRDVHLLQQLAPQRGVALVSGGEPGEVGTIIRGRLLVAGILVFVVHDEVVTRAQTFLHSEDKKNAAQLTLNGILGNR